MKIEIETKFNVKDRVLWDGEQVEIVGINIWTNGENYYRIGYDVDNGYCVDEDIHENYLHSK